MAGSWGRRVLTTLCLAVPVLVTSAAVQVVRDSCAHRSSADCLQLIHTRHPPPAIAQVALPHTVTRGLAERPLLAAGPPPPDREGKPPGPVAAAAMPLPAAALPTAAPSVATSPGPTPPMAAMRADSYPPLVQYPLSSWNLVKFRTGRIESAVLLPGRTPLGRKGVTLPAGTALELTGWAGHPRYGMRGARVLLAMCGRVVGHAEVGLPRPDIGAEVHRDLGRSGWSAMVLVDALPQCERAALGAWMVAPLGRDVFPLAGALPVVRIVAARPGLKTSDAPIPGGLATRSDVFRPIDNPPAVAITLRPARADVPVRRCAAADCLVAARLPAVPVTGYLVERRESWVLVQAGDAAGWISATDLLR